MIQQLIRSEEFTNVQKAQAGITRLFTDASKKKHFYRVMKNDVPLGVLIPNNLWEDLVEDLEALSSPNYIKSIAEARKETKHYTQGEVEKMFGIK